MEDDMPWKETHRSQEKLRFICDYLSGNYSVTELSIKYGISRKTAYKLINRFNDKDLDGLVEYSRRPHSFPNSVSDEVVSEILSIKNRFRSWGPKKIRAYLHRWQPEIISPAASTIGEILKRNGLVKHRKRTRKVAEYNKELRTPYASNDVWGADYKGQFKLRNGLYCYPLTISDSFSRYLLKCEGLSGTKLAATRSVFERAFIDYGMPLAIRTDNGIPFAGQAIGGLSSLSIWFIQLGIAPERIKKGKPQQNGIHERMHRTLKAETALNAKANMKLQQVVFEKFRDEYNNIRPHEGLNGQTPADVYQTSDREYTGRIQKPEYDDNMLKRKIKYSGEFKLDNKRYFISQRLAGEYIGLKEIDNGTFEIYYSFHKLGELDNIKKVIKRT